MAFTLEFLKIFLLITKLVAPILIALLAAIATVGFIIGKIEGWSRIDTFYYTFITATTVGYGDYPPRHPITKMLAISVAFLGLIYTGIVVAVALQALTFTIKATGRVDEFMEDGPGYAVLAISNACPVSARPPQEADK